MTMLLPVLSIYPDVIEKAPDTTGLLAPAFFTAKKSHTWVMGLVAEVFVFIAAIGLPTFVQALKGADTFVWAITW
jgi:hypothetical protein